MKHESNHAEAQHDATERLVSSLGWRQPGAALDDRVAAALGDASADPGVPAWPLRFRGALAAAAVLAIGGAVAIGVLAVLEGPDPQPAVGPSIADRSVDVVTPQPDAASPTLEQVWVASEPTGQIVMTGDRAMEAVRVTAVQHMSFEEDGVSYDVAVPVEKMVYVPVSYE